MISASIVSPLPPPLPPRPPPTGTLMERPPGSITTALVVLGIPRPSDDAIDAWADPRGPDTATTMLSCEEVTPFTLLLLMLWLRGPDTWTGVPSASWTRRSACIASDASSRAPRASAWASCSAPATPWIAVPTSPPMARPSKPPPKRGARDLASGDEGRSHCASTRSTRRPEGAGPSALRATRPRTESVAFLATSLARPAASFPISFHERPFASPSLSRPSRRAAQATELRVIRACLGRPPGTR